MSLLPGVVLLLSALLVGASRRHVPVLGAAGALCAAVAVTVATSPPPVRSVALLFTLGLVLVVVVFSSRHLDGDVDRLRYDRLLLATAGAAVLALSTGDLAVLALAWVATGAGITALVGHHGALVASERAVRSLRWARLSGDTALVVAVATLSFAAGSTSIDRVLAWAEGSPDSPALLLAGAGLIITAAARCGLLPFSRWLPLSVVAPAPVSALLHAGIVNAPVLVLLQLAPVWEGQPVLRAVLFALGLATAVATFPRLLVRTDVKTRLAWSTTAQLGFMLALLAVGAHAAAVLHMLLHGLYKAAAFLSAGDQLSRARRDGFRPTAPRTRALGTACGLLAGTALVVADSGWQHPMTAATVVVGAGAAGAGLLSLRAASRTRLAAGGLAVVLTAAVLGLAHVAAAVLELPLRADGALAWAGAAVVLALGASGAVLRTRQPVAVWPLLHRLADPVVPLGQAVRLRAASTAARPAVPLRADLHDSLREQLAEAAAAVPPAWGWQAFIATNPLLGEQHRSFDEAVAVAASRGWSALPGLPDAPRPAPDLADDLVAGWLAAYTCVGDTPWAAPGRSTRLWDWFRAVAAGDPVLPPATRAWLRDLPDEPLDTVAHLLALHARPADTARAQLLRLPGWAGYLGRRSTVGAALDVDALIDLLAVQLATLHAVGGAEPAKADAEGPVVDTAGLPAALLALQGREVALRDQLLAALRDPAPAAPARRHAADLVCCIDVRSEPLRRHLEAVADVRTAGFAGFFGLLVRRVAADGRSSDRLPALLGPAVSVTETGPAGAGVPVLVNAALRGALDAPGGGFSAVEVAALKGALGAARVLLPRWRRTPQPELHDLSWAPEQEPALLASAIGAVRAIGLHGPSTARLVVLVGHGSTSTNNPAESAFDCGACGGSRGAFNARVAAHVLNSGPGRAALEHAGLAVPTDTVFLAAEHDTALDRVVLLEPDAVPASHAGDLEALTAALADASGATAAERCRALPGGERAAGDPRRASRHVRRRALDAGEVRHEWGLAGNAFFIAAPRSLTAGLDLEGRAFLHDYDAAADPDGALLEVILTAPLVVAHWINAQYFFSTCDPEALGAGSKTAHNAVGAVGVLTGPGGDLRTGLAEQSVQYAGRPPHEPVRLLAVVAAAPSAIDAVLARHDGLAQLVRGGWLSLATVDTVTGAQRLHTPEGWQDAQPPSIPAPRRATAGASPR